jgi:hypothetical protein
VLYYLSYALAQNFVVRGQVDWDNLNLDKYNYKTDR